MRPAWTIAAVLLAAAPAGATARSAYMYSLSDSTGAIPLGWASLTWDASHAELYAVSAGIVHVFNESGMEVFSFSDFSGYGSPVAVTVREDGNLLILARDAQRSVIVRCNYRGEPIEPLELKGLPPQLARFRPDSIFQRAGRIYLADRLGLLIVIVSLDGAYVASFDLARLVGGNNGKSLDDARGLSVDVHGNMLFTMPTLFAAFVLSPDGTVRSFGQKGSLPGKFNVVAGIVADDDGNVYVADTLRSVVMVFDRALQFQNEFGYRGPKPSNLVAPSELAVGGGRVFVSQSIGPVKVFGVQVE